MTAHQSNFIFSYLKVKIPNQHYYFPIISCFWLFPHYRIEFQSMGIQNTLQERAWEFKILFKKESEDYFRFSSMLECVKHKAKYHTEKFQ